MAIADQIVSAESGGDPNAKNPMSSASGPSQFIDSTWLSTLKQHRPDITDGKSDQDLISLKNDPKLSAEMTGAYAADNQAILQKNGLPVTDGTTYLAHFAGPQGAVKVLQADPNASVEDVLGSKVVAANPFLKGMTTQGLQAWAAKKMGVSAPVPGQQQASPAANAPQQPAIPQQQAPIFAGQSMPAPPAFAPPPPMPPIFAPPRKPIDLSGLREALAARAPIFPNQGQT